VVNRQTGANHETNRSLDATVHHRAVSDRFRVDLGALEHAAAGVDETLTRLRAARAAKGRMDGIFRSPTGPDPAAK